MPTNPTLLSLNLSRRSAVGLSAIATVTIAGPRSMTFAQDATPADEGSSLAPFFDPAEVHDISVAFDQADYDAMVQTYIDADDKDWIEASVTIDGSSYEQVGMRLKGNSSLMGLRGQGSGGPGEGGAMGGVSADEPESLPWLIRMDEYVKDQNHQDIKQIVIRSNFSATALNEAVALELLQKAGLASQQSAAVRFQVNQSAPTLRLAIENPKTPWMRSHFNEDGLLYKAEATGDYSYRGDDAEKYVDVFDIEAGDTGDDRADFEPLFGFLDFINNADDTTFSAEIGEHLNMESFATYLALMTLIRNTDDIDGPGNNSYLYVGVDETYFTVVPWDMNLAFGGFGDMGENGEGRGMPDLGDVQMPDQNGDGTPEVPIPGEGEMPAFPDSGTMPRNGATPEPGSPNLGTQPDFPTGGPLGGRSNILVERTSALPDFASLITETQNRLADQLFTGGVAEELLARRSDVLLAKAGDLVSADTVTNEADGIRELFTNP